MNTFQLVKQLQHLIRSFTWGDGANKLFAEESVIISSGQIDERAIMSLQAPYCILAVGGGQADPAHSEEPDLIRTDILLRLASTHAGDPMGQSVMIGSNVEDIEAGAGQGILALEAQILNGLARLTREDGVRIQITNSSAVQGSQAGQDQQAATRDYRLQAWHVINASYPPGRAFAVADGGGGTADLTWTLPPSRFDYRRMVVRRAAGATAPTSITDGTGVALGGSPDGVAATSVSDSPGVGEFSWALFVTYDDYGNSADTSTAASGSGTVTVT